MKRAFDLFVVLISLPIIFLFLLCVGLLVRFKLGQPLFFKQHRPGLHGKLFCMYKFRTMSDLRDSEGVLLPDNRRLHGLGQFLRSTSLDELPGLWNVFVGDMSLVGPRPLLAEYLPLYSTQQLHYLMLRIQVLIYLRKIICLKGSILAYCQIVLFLLEVNLQQNLFRLLGRSAAIHFY